MYNSIKISEIILDNKLKIRTMERTISGKEIYRVALNIYYFDAIRKKKSQIRSSEILCYKN